MEQPMMTDVELPEGADEESAAGSLQAWLWRRGEAREKSIAGRGCGLLPWQNAG